MFETKVFNKPTSWDLLAIILTFAGIMACAWTFSTLNAPFTAQMQTPIDLSPLALPYYAARSVLRMTIALLFSLVVTMIFGTLMARSRLAEKIGLPLLDIFQSIPILGFLSIGVMGFINLFPGKMLGPECAAIFAIFTSQAWNMILSFYSSLKTIPRSYTEAGLTLGLSQRARFWRIKVPYALPPLLWNMMMSLSAGWFFVVAAEAISVAGRDIFLPGIGSYIATAITEQNSMALLWALLAMFTVILIYDQCVFQPMLAWAERFKDNPVIKRPWFLTMMQNSRLIEWIRSIEFSLPSLPKVVVPVHFKFPIVKILMMGAFIVFSVFIITKSALPVSTLSLAEVQKAVILGFYTLGKIVAMLILSAILWIPLGVWLGRSEKRSRIAGPIIQFAAAFPANLVYPIAAIAIVEYQLNVTMWSMFLMILGNQWYLLFNVIAGTREIENSMFDSAKMLHLKGWRWWYKFMIPALAPKLVTGFMVTAGGCWNTCIVAEVIHWGDTHLISAGLGAYIGQNAASGNTVNLGMGVAVMCAFVMLLNHLVWQPMYNRCAKEAE